MKKILLKIQIYIYIKKIRRQLLSLYPDNQASKICNMFFQESVNYVKKHPTTNFEELINNIGITDKLLNIEPYKIDEEITIKNKLQNKFKITICISLIVLGAFTTYIAHSIIVAKQHSVAYVEEEIKVLYETTYPDETDFTEYTSESFSEPDSTSE